MLLELFTAVVVLICIYTIRHYCFTVNRLIGQQRHPYVDVDTADWPPVTVLIAAHNEEAVVADILSALLEVDYPADKLAIVPVNDRSIDGTREIIDSYVVRYPGRITPFHRSGGKPGKAAALKDAMAYVNTEIMLVFDADYVPGKADWLAHGRPVEGTAADVPTAGRLAHDDVVTCGLEDPVSEVRARVDSSPYGFALVTASGGVLLGRLRASVMRDSGGRAEEAMEPGLETAKDWVRPATRKGPTSPAVNSV